MAYTSLYRRFRPSDFTEIVGQEHITKTLINQVKTGSINHAYLFTGSRGTGKTSTAKIFAKAINCLSPVNGSPCHKCDVCKALSDPANVDIVEIDAASNNRVDEIRDIREKVKFLPVSGKYKVYIIDEVHMLTESAFNALLKTLEEPPSHIVFILATTEVHKLPTTILSRCMRFDFRLIPIEILEKHLSGLLSQIGIKATPDAIRMIAKSAEGSDRDMLSIADCVCAYSFGKEITSDDVMKVIGVSDKQTYLDLTTAMRQKDVGKCFEILDKVFTQGKNMISFAKDLTLHFRNLLVARSCKNVSEMLGLSAEMIEKYIAQANSIEPTDLMDYMKIFSSIEADLKYAISPKTLIETAIVTAISEIGELKKNEI